MRLLVFEVFFAILLLIVVLLFIWNHLRRVKRIQAEEEEENGITR